MDANKTRACWKFILFNHTFMFVYAFFVTKHSVLFIEGVKLYTGGGGEEGCHI